MKNVQILIIGTEVTNGFIIDRNSNFFATELYALGYRVKKITVIPDDAKVILSTLEAMKHTGDLIITSGGLGPTEDDLTVDVLCTLLECEAIHDQYALDKTTFVFANQENIDTNIAFKQTRIPQLSEPLLNEVGLAPGIWIPQIPLIALPGFPVEIKSIWKHALEKIQSISLQHLHSKIIPIWGIGESTLFSELKIPLDIEYGVHALPYGSRLFLSSQDPIALENLSSFIHEKYKEFIIDNPLKEVISILKSSNKTIGTIESCTGGLAGKLITDIEGVSSIYKGTIVAYANSIKENIVCVSKGTLLQYGAVSEQTAKEMAEYGSKVLGVDICIGYTGIAGPTGGNSEKPVGTVYCSIYNALEDTSIDFHAFLPIGRDRFREAIIYLSFLKLWQKQKHFYAT